MLISLKVQLTINFRNLQTVFKIILDIIVNLTTNALLMNPNLLIEKQKITLTKGHKKSCCVFFQPQQNLFDEEFYLFIIRETR